MKKSVKIAIITAVSPIIVALVYGVGDMIQIRIASKNVVPSDDFYTKENVGNIKVSGSDNNIIHGFDNNITIQYDDKDYPKNEDNKKERVTLTGKMKGYWAGSVDGEWIIIGKNGGTESYYESQLTNENNVTINIDNIMVKVLDYKSFNEFKVEDPAGGATLNDIFFWNCNIGPEKKYYNAIFIGTDEDNTKDLSREKYVSIEATDTGKLCVKMFPNTPGLYEIKIIIEYTSYNGELKTIGSENIKFIYDPEGKIAINKNTKIRGGQNGVEDFYARI